MYIYKYKPISFSIYFMHTIPCAVVCIVLYSIALEYCIFCCVVALTVYHVIFTLYCLWFGLYIECVVCSLEQLTDS